MLMFAKRTLMTTAVNKLWVPTALVVDKVDLSDMLDSAVFEMLWGNDDDVNAIINYDTIKRKFIKAIKNLQESVIKNDNADETTTDDELNKGIIRAIKNIEHCVKV